MPTTSEADREAPLTREEAISRVRHAGAVRAAAFVDALIALGVLKVVDPPTQDTSA
jgi:hypothetical protein